MNVLVVGGSGSAGAPLVSELIRRGHSVRVLTRSGSGHDAAERVRGDVVTGDGLAAALRGIHAVVHVANGVGRGARPVLVDGTRRLVAAAADEGVAHVVVLSITGIERVPFSYHRAKVEQERVLAGGGVPWTVVRATQFHELVSGLFASTRRTGVVLVPKGVPVRPVAARSVAAALADAVEAGPSGLVGDVAGPEVLRLEQAARIWRTATRSRRPLVHVRVPGALGRQLRAGVLVPGDARVEGPTYGAWLAHPVASPVR